QSRPREASKMLLVLQAPLPSSGPNAARLAPGRGRTRPIDREKERTAEPPFSASHQSVEAATHIPERLPLRVMHPRHCSLRRDHTDEYCPIETAVDRPQPSLRSTRYPPQAGPTIWTKRCRPSRSMPARLPRLQQGSPAHNLSRRRCSPLRPFPFARVRESLALRRPHVAHVRQYDALLPPLRAVERSAKS